MLHCCYSESLLELGFGLIQLAQISLVVREQVLLANIGHLPLLPVSDQWNLEKCWKCANLPLKFLQK